MEFSFDGGQIKRRAWEMLKGCYWNAFIIALLSGLLSSVVSGIVSQIFNVVRFIVSIAAGTQIELSGSFFGELFNTNSVSGVITAVAVYFAMLLFSLLVSYLVSVFAVEQITIGTKKSYMELADNGMNLDLICSGFTRNYKNSVRVAAVKWLYIYVGYICFVVPGIVFYYRYMMTPYILAENPDIDPMRALEISRTMMKGNKLDVFIFQLSFIGWWLLGFIACCAGTAFVLPYYNTAEMMLYRDIRNNAVATGAVSDIELGGVNIF